MKTIQIDKEKTLVSEILSQIEDGEEVTLTTGDNHEEVAVLSPVVTKEKAKKIRLGILKGKASFKIHSDWEMTDEEFLGLRSI